MHKGCKILLKWLCAQLGKIFLKFKTSESLCEIKIEILQRKKTVYAQDKHVQG